MRIGALSPTGTGQCGPGTPLRAAAFGPEPGEDVPAGPAPGERWLRAVALGGRGRYAAAAALLLPLIADPDVPAAVAAHAAVTLASHRRQVGGHAAARILDGRALRLATVALLEGPVPPDPDGTDALAARVDALVGLAADAVGLGTPAVAEQLLDAADRCGHPSWRPLVRACWVRAELALVRGDAAGAVGPAVRALERAQAAGAARHVLKSRLVLAVARAAAGPNGAAVTELDAAAAEAERSGLLPLRWPALLAAADALVASVPDANDNAAPTSSASVNDRVSGAARRRHAAMATVSVLYQFCDPIGRRLMGESVWVPHGHRVT